MHGIDSTKTDCRRSPRRATVLLQFSEADLLKRARSRDAGAFEELVCRTELRLYRVAMRHVRNESDAQEILQESYLSAWRSLPTFEGRARFASWMHRIVVNISLMRLRARMRRPEVAVNDAGLPDLQEVVARAWQVPTGCGGWPDRPDERLQSAELRCSIEVAVNSLPRTLKAVFLLRDVCELSSADSAARLGVSVSAAKTRLHRARKVLRESLGDYVAC
jgi:RNA polymerase sigma-70 factor (ECF subfamily)